MLHLWHQHRLHDAFGFIGVVAQEVDRFADFGHRVAPGLERFFDQQCAEHGRLRLHGISGLAQNSSALGDVYLAPLLIAAPARFISLSDVFDIKLGHHRHVAGLHCRQQRLTHGGHGQIEPCAVFAGTGVGTKQVGRQRQAGVRLQTQRRDQQILHTHRFVGQLVHKA